MNVLKKIIKSFSTRNVLSKAIKDFEEIDDDYFDEVFDQIEVEGRATWDSYNENLDIEIDNVDITANDFKNLISCVSEDTNASNINNPLELVQPWINKRIKLNGRIPTYDFEDSDLEDTELDIYIKLMSFKYNKENDSLIVDKLKVLDYAY